MNSMNVILLIQFFVIKHFIVDYVLQTPYQYRNKGNLKHFGGYLHAFMHGVVSFTGLVFIASTVETNNRLFCLITYLCVFEAVTHYFIDYSKIHINKLMGWTPTTHDEFWILLGLDQLLHFQVYILIIYFVTVKV